MSAGLARAVEDDRAAYEGHGERDPVRPSGWSQEKTAYNPVDHAIKDLSLGFYGGHMVVSTTHLNTRAAVDKDGKPQKDAYGRQVFEPQWKPTTATTRGEMIRAEDELPDHLRPDKPFVLVGQVGEQPRFSPAALEAFAAGDKPPADLAADLAAAIGRRVAFAGPADLTLMVAFLASTYVFPLARRSPILALGSATFGAGKSTTMEVGSRVAFNAHLTGRATLAVSLRLASQARSTLFLDEQDALASGREGADMIQFLSCRTDRGALYRQMGPSGEVCAFEVFGPTMIANVKGLVSVLRSRTIEVAMVPLEPGDARLAADIDAEDWLALRDGLLLWAGANWQAIKDSHDNDPAMRVGANRHADKWRLILACGYHLGGQEMFEELWHAATAAAASGGGADDIDDAMALSVAGVLAENASLGRGFHVGLKLMRAKAIESVEEDRAPEISSKRVAAFARGLGLTVMQMSTYDHANGVVFESPEATAGLLLARFPHLSDLFAAMFPGGSVPGGPAAP